jgi:hypothetical protein
MQVGRVRRARNAHRVGTPVRTSKLASADNSASEDGYRRRAGLLELGVGDNATAAAISGETLLRDREQLKIQASSSGTRRGRGPGKAQVFGAAHVFTGRRGFSIGGGWGNHRILSPSREEPGPPPVFHILSDLGRVKRTSVCPAMPGRSGGSRMDDRVRGFRLRSRGRREERGPQVFGAASVFTGKGSLYGIGGGVATSSRRVWRLPRDAGPPPVCILADLGRVP